MAHSGEEGEVFRPMAQETITESTRADNGILRAILPDDPQTWLCPHCETEVELTKDRVFDHIIEHPATILRETCYWRCPLCNAVAGQESWEFVEAIEYISSNP